MAAHKEYLIAKTFIRIKHKRSLQEWVKETISSVWNSILATSETHLLQRTLTIIPPSAEINLKIVRVQWQFWANIAGVVLNLGEREPTLVTITERALYPHTIWWVILLILAQVEMDKVLALSIRRTVLIEKALVELLVEINWLHPKDKNRIKSCQW